MVKKIHKGAEGASESSAGADAAQFAGTVKDSAQQIWLAGLGAFAKAQEEGTKVFDALVKEGVAIQRKTQSAAEDKISEATSRMANMATGFSSKASGQWDKLETIFEDRVNRALTKLGVPTAKELGVLVDRIQELQHSVEKLAGKPAARRSAARSSSRPAAKAAKAAKVPKTAAKRVARKSA